MASKRRLKRKSCTGKVKYETFEEANRVLFNFKRFKKEKSPMSVYRCKFCNGFHFGHTPWQVIQAMKDRRRAKGSDADDAWS